MVSRSWFNVCFVTVGRVCASLSRCAWIRMLFTLIAVFRCSSDQYAQPLLRKGLEAPMSSQGQDAACGLGTSSSASSSAAAPTPTAAPSTPTPVTQAPETLMDTMATVCQLRARFGDEVSAWRGPTRLISSFKTFQS